MNLTCSLCSCSHIAPHCHHHQVLLQPMWDYVACHLESIVTSPFFPVFLAFSGFVIFSLPFAVFDVMGERWPSLYRYKIQKDKRPTLKMMGRCLWHALYNQLVYVCPAVVINGVWMRAGPLPVEAPTFLGLFIQVLGCLLLFDFQYFIWHMMHHKVGWLYKSVHAIHHEYIAPFSWASQYLSGVELLTVGFFSSMNPVLLQCHPLAAWATNVVSIWMSVEDHVGYDFPWSLHRVIPWGLYGGAQAHDMHHQRPNSNYAPFFGHWDMIFGTSHIKLIKEPVAKRLY